MEKSSENAIHGEDIQQKTTDPKKFEKYSFSIFFDRIHIFFKEIHILTPFYFNVLTK